MQGKHLFEYAVIRIVPRVEREEFLNAGIVLYCKELNFLQAKFEVKVERVCAFCTKTDIEILQQYLASFDKICKGDKDGGPISQLDTASRFRWLTATRSTVLQTSKVHPGFTDNPVATLEKLFEELVV